jgi:hypothetical protein
VRQDRHIGEDDVAGGVVEMAMRVDEPGHRLAGLSLDGGAELFRKPRILLGVDGDDAGRRIDGAGIGIAAGADPGMNARGDGDELRLRISHAGYAP